MSEAIAAKRIRAGRTAYDFPCIFGMIARGELHLSGFHQLAGQLTEENHKDVLQRAKHKSMREIEQLIAEISPKPDVPVEFHHRTPYGRSGTHDVENIELRCRAHNQYEADLEYGAPFMAARRRSIGSWYRTPGFVCHRRHSTTRDRGPFPADQFGRPPPSPALSPAKLRTKLGAELSHVRKAEPRLRGVPRKCAK